MESSKKDEEEAFRRQSIALGFIPMRTSALALLTVVAFVAGLFLGARAARNAAATGHVYATCRGSE